MRFLLIFFLCLAGCQRAEPLYHEQGYVFGTLVDISIYGESDEKAHAVSSKILSDFQQLHQRLHAWQPSELSIINSAITSGKTTQIKPDLAAMIAEAREYSALTQGSFNPAIGKLIRAWGFHRDSFETVNLDAETIRGLVHLHPQLSDLKIENGKVSSQNRAVQLDFGGYAKGYALDQALTYLQSQHVKHALINIGGNIIALGQHGKKPWRVGIQHPRQPNAIAWLDLPSGWAIGTSGDYQRFFMRDGKRYCHIIDPATGYPAQGIQSATVLIPPSKTAGRLSDVLSKPLFIAAPNQRTQIAKELNLLHYLLIESDRRILISSAMSKRIHWVNSNTTKQVITLP